MELTPRQIEEKMNNANAELYQLNAELSEKGENKARAEKEYRVSKAQKILELRSEGESVTLTTDLATGSEDVAELKMKRDIAETEWYVCKSKIDHVSSRMNDLRTMLVQRRKEAEGVL